MANFKRKRAKNARHFCHMCKYYKMTGMGRMSRPAKEWARRERMKDDVREQLDG